MSPADFQTFAQQAEHERSARGWQEYDRTSDWVVGKIVHPKQTEESSAWMKQDWALKEARQHGEHNLPAGTQVWFSGIVVPGEGNPYMSVTAKGLGRGYFTVHINELVPYNPSEVRVIESKPSALRRFFARLFGGAA